MRTTSRRSALTALLAGVLGLAAASCARPAAVGAAATPASPHVLWAGVRSSAYGIKPFPQPAEWEYAIKTMSGYYPGSTPVAVWIVGRFSRPRTCRLEFPGRAAAEANIQFDDIDKHEPYLRAFDRAGIKVFLQVEPANADMKTLVDLVLERYGRHPCVIGFGVDVEWYREADRPKQGVPVDDATGRQWESWVKAHNAKYRLFIKHWDQRWLCPTYRGEIVFVDDSQIVKSEEALVAEFEAWGRDFRPNPVMFQIGYRSDKTWWSRLPVPPRDLGRAIAAKVEQPCGIIWVDFSLTEVLPLGPGRPLDKPPLVGVKLYEAAAPYEGLFRSWWEDGINTLFVSETLARTKDFRTLAAAHGLPLFVIFPVFQDPEALKKDPGLAAITASGAPARDDWVEFVCPAREGYLRAKAEQLKRVVADCGPYAVSLDFIRYFVFWEKVAPDRTLESLPQTCFCPVCLAGFTREMGVTLPAGLVSTAEKASWILSNHAADWTEWKCRTIARAVERLAKAAREVDPDVMVNLHAVPWRHDDFGGAARSVAGQDLPRLARFVDLISPMCYHHMVRRTPAWVHDVVADIAARTGAKVLASTQVSEAYVPQPLSAEEFRAAAAEALKPPSIGVVFWSWDALAKSPEKQALLRRLTIEKNAPIR